MTDPIHYRFENVADFNGDTILDPLSLQDIEGDLFVFPGQADPLTTKQDDGPADDKTLNSITRYTPTVIDGQLTQLVIIGQFDSNPALDTVTIHLNAGQATLNAVYNAGDPINTTYALPRTAPVAVSQGHNQPSLVTFPAS